MLMLNHFPPTANRGPLGVRPPLTLDGHWIRPGESFYCRARMVNPLVRVRVLGLHRTATSWLDGRQVAFWEVRARDGRMPFVVEPWMLSKARVGEVLDELKAVYEMGGIRIVRPN